MPGGHLVLFVVVATKILGQLTDLTSGAVLLVRHGYSSPGADCTGAWLHAVG